MKKIHLLSMVCMAFVLNGCDHYSNKLASMDAPAHIAPAAGYDSAALMQEDMTFGQHLKNEYMALAAYEQNQRKDYRAAKYYTQKIETLESGQLVSPADMNDFNVGANDKYEIRDAYEALTYSLQTKRIPENRVALAVAQTRYDCWVDQEEEKALGKKAFFKDCRSEFYQAMDNVVAAEYTQEDFYNEFFDLGF